MKICLQVKIILSINISILIRNKKIQKYVAIGQPLSQPNLYKL